MAARTPLYERHVALGARMVDFAGFSMPLQYSSIREEHLAVRERAGIFDVSHMGEVLLRGEPGLASVARLVANDTTRLEAAQGLYGVMCNDEGGVVDDVVVMRGLDGDHAIVVVNAACREKDLAWMRSHLLDGAALHDHSEEVALLAVQGPLALEAVQRITDTDLSSLRPFHQVGARLAGLGSRVSVVSRTGYTGEDGVELFVDAAAAPALWDAILEAGRADGLLPCGLGARDTLRLEAALRLYGQDMDEGVDPFSAGLGWTVKLDGRDVVGGDALRRIREQGPPRATIGLAFDGRTIPRHGQEVRAGGTVVGTVTSGSFAFTLGHPVALALVERTAASEAELDVDVRGAAVRARRVPLPFYRRGRTAG